MCVHALQTRPIAHKSKPTASRNAAILMSAKSQTSNATLSFPSRPLEARFMNLQKGLISLRGVLSAFRI
jgi:hypothetical protein